MRYCSPPPKTASSSSAGRQNSQAQPSSPFRCSVAPPARSHARTATTCSPAEKSIAPPSSRASVSGTRAVSVTSVLTVPREAV